MYQSANILPGGFGYLPPTSSCDVQVFFNTGTGTGNWEVWKKPSGVTMAYVMAIAGGGGGGGGFTRATTVAGGGGAGGACSGIARTLIPTLFLPHELYVQVGKGGAGGTGSGQAGGNGTNSYVAYGIGVTAGTTIPNLFLESGANAPGGGAAGSGAGAATGGAVPTIGTRARVGGSDSFGFHTFNVGLVGAAGGTPTAAGSAITAGFNLIALTPGSGGGGVTSSGTGFAGGAISLQAAMDFADGSLASAILVGGSAGSGAAVGGAGNAGVQSWYPFYGTGGTGGGSADGQVGGAGANGAIGCGGGGGGAGTTGGRGGDGGNGLVVIISW